MIENRYAGEQDERFNDHATELVALKVDVLVAVTRSAAAAAQRTTATIPIVFVVVPDPVGMNFVASLARPSSCRQGDRVRRAQRAPHSNGGQGRSPLYQSSHGMQPMMLRAWADAERWTDK